MKCKMWSGESSTFGGGGGGTCGSNHLSCTKYKHAVYELEIGGEGRIILLFLFSGFCYCCVCVVFVVVALILVHGK